MALAKRLIVSLRNGICMNSFVSWQSEFWPIQIKQAETRQLIAMAFRTVLLLAVLACTAMALHGQVLFGNDDDSGIVFTLNSEGRVERIDLSGIATVTEETLRQISKQSTLEQLKVSVPDFGDESLRQLVGLPAR